MSDVTLIEWERDVDLLVVDKSAVELRPSEAAIRGRYEK